MTTNACPDGRQDQGPTGPLDALAALGAQRDALILAGAQAVYLHTGPAGLAVAEYTTDADIAINPRLLSELWRKMCAQELPQRLLASCPLQAAVRERDPGDLVLLNQPS